MEKNIIITILPSFFLKIFDEISDNPKKYKTLTNGTVERIESERFLNDVQNLRNLGKSELSKLNIQVEDNLRKNKILNKTIF